MTSSHNQKKLTFITNVKTNWPLLVLPYVALVLLHVLLSLGMQYPNIADEFGYLGRARYLAGFSHFTHDVGIWHFGYSLFLLPSFWIFSDPSIIYKAVLITNSLLLSALYFPLCYILNTVFDIKKKLSAYISIACCLYPAFVLQSNLAWSENAFIPVYAFFIASFGAFIKHKSHPTIVLFSCLGAFLYTIHPRALPILPIIILYMAFLAYLHQATKTQLFLSVVIIASIFFATLTINNHFLYVHRVEAHTALLTKQLSLLFTPSKFVLLPLTVRAAARLQYLILSTYGLFFLGSFFAFEILTQRWKEDRLSAFSNAKFNITLLLLLSSVGIFASSTLISGPRGDHLFYGRYNEGFLALYLMLALVFLNTKASSGRHNILNLWIAASVIIIILMIIIVGNYGYTELTTLCQVSNFNIINTLGIFPFIAILRRLDILLVSLILIPLMFFLMYAFRKRFRLGLVLLVSYFFVVFISGYSFFIQRASLSEQFSTLVPHIRSLEHSEIVSYDMAFENPDTWGLYQYLLPHVSFRPFNSLKGDQPQSRVVISGKTWKDSRRLQSKLIASENSIPEMPLIIRKVRDIIFKKPLPFRDPIDQSLWLLPEETRFPLSPSME